MQGLRSRGRDLVAPRHVASSWTSNPTLQADSYSQYHRGNANFFFFFKFVLIRESCRQEEARSRRGMGGENWF